MHIIAKILQELIQKGLVESVKGLNGGFFLDKQVLQCSLEGIVKATDGDKIFKGCGLGLKQFPCPIHTDYKIVRGNFKLRLENSKLRPLLKNWRRASYF